MHQAPSQAATPPLPALTSIDQRTPSRDEVLVVTFPPVEQPHSRVAAALAVGPDRHSTAAPRLAVQAS
jgi:hypothetical protein